LRKHPTAAPALPAINVGVLDRLTSAGVLVMIGDQIEPDTAARSAASKSR
jgi:hypothetical protein